MSGPEGGEWVFSAEAARNGRDVPVRCGDCGRFGTDFDTYTYWVGLVAHATLCAECAERLAAEGDTLPTPSAAEEGGEEMITVATYRADGTLIDEAEAESPAAAKRCAEVLQEDAVEAGHELRDVTVRFSDSEGNDLRLGLDATLAAA